MSQTKRFEASGLDMEMLVISLRDWAAKQNMETQRLELETGATAIQAHPTAKKLQKWLGFDVALNIELFYESSGGLHVTVGHGNWVNVKRGAMTGVVVVGVAVLWPLA